jgi:hypothetical protein
MLKDRLLLGVGKCFRVQILFASLGFVSFRGLNSGPFSRFSDWLGLFSCFMILFLSVNFSRLGDAGRFRPTPG